MIHPPIVGKPRTAGERCQTIPMVVLLALSVASACTSPPAPRLQEPTQALLGTWVRPIATQPSRQEGLVLDAEGRFGLIGIHSMHGLTWQVQGAEIVLFTNTDRYPSPQATRLPIQRLTAEALELGGPPNYLRGAWRRDDAAAGRITGTVRYRQRSALPPEAAIHLTLEDASRPEAPPAFVAGQTIPTQGRQVPIPFVLYFATADVAPGQRYQFQAAITVAGQRRFISAEPYPLPDPRRADLLDMVVIPAVALRPMTGLFRYLADAPLFQDCASHLRYPVAMAADYLSLERAYLAMRREPGQPIYAELQGHIELRAPMEGPGRQEVLVVDRFETLKPLTACPPSTTAVYPLEGTTWILAALFEQPLAIAAGGKPPFLVLERDAKRVRGFAGCNNFFGGYRLDGARLSFTETGATMMICPDRPELEPDFMRALANTEAYRLSGGEIVLLRDNQELARLIAQPP